MAVSAEQVFATLEDGPAWPKWVNVIRAVNWTSPKPYGRGTTRTVTMVGGVVVDELFSAFEPARRMSFSVCAANIGLLSGLGELYETVPISSDRCVVRWTLAMTFAGPLRRLEQVARDFVPTPE